MFVTNPRWPHVYIPLFVGEKTSALRLLHSKLYEYTKGNLENTEILEITKNM